MSPLAAIGNALTTRDISLALMTRTRWVPLATDAPDVHPTVAALGVATGHALGLLILHDLRSSEASTHYYKVFAGLNDGGQSYRLLSLHGPLAAALAQHTDAECGSIINQILVPSRVMTMGATRIVCMPWIDEPDYVRTLTQSQIDDFMSRLIATRLEMGLDVRLAHDRAGALVPDDNLVLLGGRIYLLDAGDVLHARGATTGMRNAALAEVRKQLQARVI
ncbi:MAG: hypothetical protein HYV02_01305 [Deltaproteobacteria bacterium]|nr:hypothetical protein [Deltaproteobacteria bacterium]